MDTSQHPFRIVVFGESDVTKGKGKRAHTEKQGFAYILWNPDEETATRAGRPTFGSFEWYGLSLARRVALDELQKPGIQQIAIKTNQDRDIARLYKSKWEEYAGQAKFQFA